MVDFPQSCKMEKVLLQGLLIDVIDVVIYMNTLTEIMFWPILVKYCI